MNRNRTMTLAATLAAMLVAALFAPLRAPAHCDTMGGPVVQAAQKALDSGDANLVLIWVPKKDEVEIKGAFQKTLAVRKLSPEAKALADMYFFETLVRVHRAGEGEPYTGLKPGAEEELGPAIPAADKALEEGSVEPLARLLTEAVRDGVEDRFKDALARKGHNKDDVEAGRGYVEAYVAFLHYVEGVYEAAKGPAHEPAGESKRAATHPEAHAHSAQ